MTCYSTLVTVSDTSTLATVPAAAVLATLPAVSVLDHCVPAVPETPGGTWPGLLTFPSSTTYPGVAA